ncbi:MAG TPA: flagellar hook-length control protein FliK [Methylotenera sp.]|nr:flagellar hook-length control protein FliK [Methylotenera sp.]HPH04983.1 flagellar hook-length control protein FliK [Methylotenera sp.]HPN00245.1 flagellar hook-length control protein FliK [Methylotenera sp.]
MLKTLDISAVLPIAKILAVEKIGDPLQALTSRANQLIAGQEYLGKVTATAQNGAQLVEVDGKLLKMELGAQVQKGQTLTLRYMHSNPAPTFYLLSANQAGSDASTAISPAGQLIGSILQQAEEAGSTERFQAVSVVTQNPKDVPQLTQDLKQAVQHSGLFYEAHLADVATGKRSIESVRLELQNVVNNPNNNTLNPTISTLPAQQLAMLENQRLSWHGEVWQGQAMDWDVYVEPRSQGEHETTPIDTQPRPVSSEITLHLPHLGKVSARVGIVEGRVQINLLTQDATTLATFKNARQQLFAAMVAQGQTVDALTVGQYE